MWTMGGCIMHTTIRLLLLICPLFLSLHCSKFKIFITLFSGTVRPKMFKLGTLVDNGWMYQNQAAATFLSLYFFFFFLSNYQTLTIFVTFFSGTVRPRKLKLGTHVNSGCMYRFNTGIRLLLLLICPIIGPFFFLSNFQLQICLSPLITL